MHAAAVFFSAPTLLFPQHRMGNFNFGELGATVYARLFNASFEFEFVSFGFILDLGQKVVGAIPSWSGVRKRALPWVHTRKWEKIERTGSVDEWLSGAFTKACYDMTFFAARGLPVSAGTGTRYPVACLVSL